MTLEEMKKQAAAKALTYVKDDTIVGVGTGSTVNYFIAQLADIKHKISGAVSSSKASTELLRQHGITVFDLNEINELPVYIDGADEINQQMHMIKGGGAALTEEKIVAAVAKQFICIVDESKQKASLGEFPLPVEVVTSARSYVAREIVKLGGAPVYREGVVTDNGNVILDVHELVIDDPIAMETTLNQIVGVVTNGLFAMRSADTLIVGSPGGAQTFEKPAP